MRKKHKLQLLWDQCRAVLMTLALSDLVILILLMLYRLSLDLWMYYTILIIFASIIYVLMKVAEIRKMLSDLEVDDFDYSNYSPAAYQFLVKLHEYQDKFIDMANKNEHDRRELSDYFSMWTHQAKLPVSAIKLQFDSGNPDISEIKSQMVRLEGYVNSAMAYVRANSPSSDFEIHHQNIDQIVREEIRANASSFIRKNISVDFEDSGLEALTDSKWLSFSIGQILSNALKYSPEGSTVHICTDPEKRKLVIRDEGKGISPQDLPRICEKGFTGFQGRQNREASGIGLYLCSQILHKLNHSLNIESEVGKGTTVTIGFPKEKTFWD